MNGLTIGSIIFGTGVAAYGAAVFVYTLGKLKEGDKETRKGIQSQISAWREDKEIINELEEAQQRDRRNLLKYFQENKDTIIENGVMTALEVETQIQLGKQLIKQKNERAPMWEALFNEAEKIKPKWELMPNSQTNSKIIDLADFARNREG